MQRSSLRLLAWAAVAAFAVPLVSTLEGCKSEVSLPQPDPKGSDLVRGAIVAATEESGGVRLYKILQVDTIPDPAGDEFHMIAYDPKASTFQEAAQLHRDKKLKVALNHILVRKVLFMPRDHRVVATEPVTDAERLPILKSQR
jgi:hypothetical protein